MENLQPTNINYETGNSIPLPEIPEEVKQKLEPLKGDFKVEAERQVRISFILSEIAKKENIKVEETDFEVQFQSISKRVGRPVDQIKAHYKEHGEHRETLEIQTLSEKVVQWIKNKASITES